MINLGVDGFFTDFPATGVSVVNSVTGEFVQSPQNPDLGVVICDRKIHINNSFAVAKQQIHQILILTK